MHNAHHQDQLIKQKKLNHVVNIYIKHEIKLQISDLHYLVTPKGRGKNNIKFEQVISAKLKKIQHQKHIAIEQ